MQERDGTWNMEQNGTGWNRMEQDGTGRNRTEQGLQAQVVDRSASNQVRRQAELDARRTRMAGSPEYHRVPKLYTIVIQLFTMYCLMQLDVK